MFNFSRKLKWFLITIFVFSFFHSAKSQDIRSYQYDLIDYKIQVNKDSTFDVSENQTFDYIGTYNKGYRSIPYKDISGITDVIVLDGETGQLLKYSSKVLEKTDPANWGYYTFYNQNGTLNIEWYYKVSNKTHKWIINYKVHGGIGFYNDHDEIYWNLFTNYDVPVKKVTALILPPEGDYDAKSISYSLYTTLPNKTNTISLYADKTLRVNASDFSPQMALTVAVGWPKGIITKGAFWKDWALLNWQYLLSFLIFLFTILFLFFYWFFTEKWHQGKGTIVAEYEPPENLKPAMAELIVTERITKQSWPATVIDLAVRGYLKIEEDYQSFKSAILAVIGYFKIHIFINHIGDVWSHSNINIFFFRRNGLSIDPLVYFCIYRGDYL